MTSTLASSPTLVAHGVGGRTDLPVPTGLAIAAAGTAVLVSFLALGALWRTPQLTGGRAGRPLPAGLARLLDSPVFRGVLRAVVLVLTLVVVAAAFLGPSETRFNLAPYILYVTFWAGMVLVSLLFGPIWRVVNPLRVVHAGLARVVRVDPDEGLRPLPPRVGLWPAAVWLVVFTWLELVFPDRAEPQVVGAFFAVYLVVNVWLGLIFGRRWFAQGDGFEVWFSLVGRLSPLGRRDDGRLVVRNPLDGVAAEPVRPGLVATVVVIIGSTAFDGLSRTIAWTNNVAADDVVLGSLGYFGAVALIAVAYVGAARLAAVTARMGKGTRTPLRAADLPGRFAPTLIPIAVGYTIAHYFSLLFLDGQVPIALASDPFGKGWNLFGTADLRINYALLTTTLIAAVQIGAVVVGHVLAVVSAHDRALVEIKPVAAATRSQYPLLVLMVGLTCLAIGLLVGT
ncbi:MAG: hypothetical protein QOC98_423 [Frankiaceae bacterium]|nr:hypothetical protein [Frankiaceae bacterium]